MRLSRAAVSPRKPQSRAPRPAKPAALQTRFAIVCRHAPIAPPFAARWRWSRLATPAAASAPCQRCFAPAPMRAASVRVSAQTTTLKRRAVAHGPACNANRPANGWDRRCVGADSIEARPRTSSSFETVNARAAGSARALMRTERNGALVTRRALERVSDRILCVGPGRNPTRRDGDPESRDRIRAQSRLPRRDRALRRHRRDDWR